MKRVVSIFQYELLRKEFQYLEDIGELAPQQAKHLLSFYEVPSQKKEPLNFIKVLSMIGALLIGLGVLSFVASNWAGLSDLTKFSVLLLSLILGYFVAWLTEYRKPILSKSLYYISVFVYGAEIFYIGQLFHLGGKLENAFLAWAIGVFPLAIYLKDKFLYGLSFVLIYLVIELKFMFVGDQLNPSTFMLIILPLLFAVWYFLFNKYRLLLVANLVLLYQFIQMKFAIQPLEQNDFPMVFTILLPLLFAIGHKFFNKSNAIFVVNSLLFLQWIAMTFYYFEVERVAVLFVIFLLVGITITHVQLPSYKHTMKNLGIIISFISGLILTARDLWMEGMDMSPNSFTFPWWIVFGIGYMIYGLFLVYRQQLIGVVIVSVLIFRFYIDVSLVFLNKSIAFLIGGIILLGLGFWFEKTRRGERRNEQKSTK
ncbi:DUF2157 domain-containing protein [Bacillus sp. 31A1R]|uniref:DUF2157 domain-containing protein n=1 Tax=Robertmurraya mangrovi TaxID=3098077 RepID=A0ABU5IZA5_9BACI|nr:DUF2157 domain-containing protein [Bacillus sp. 31A1R]MDZ5472457.1 DUF2157 domain-containing protein [Bacillus sp. 31A1R]